jgi:hypothetical protein
LLFVAKLSIFDQLTENPHKPTETINLKPNEEPAFVH